MHFLPGHNQSDDRVWPIDNPKKTQTTVIACLGSLCRCCRLCAVYSRISLFAACMFWTYRCSFCLLLSVTCHMKIVLPIFFKIYCARLQLVQSAYACLFKGTCNHEHVISTAGLTSPAPRPYLEWICFHVGECRPQASHMFTSSGGYVRYIHGGIKTMGVTMSVSW